MVNKVFLIGNVGGDPTIRCFENGNSVAKFSLGTSERYKDKDGQYRELTEWHTIEAWGKPAGIIDQYVRKGDKLHIEGRIHYEEYTDRENVRRYKTVIRLENFEMLTPKPKQEQEAPASKPEATSEPSQVPLPPLEAYEEPLF